MTFKHQKNSGKTTIIMDWQETRQVMAGIGFDRIREAIRSLVPVSLEAQEKEEEKGNETPPIL